MWSLSGAAQTALTSLRSNAATTAAGPTTVVSLASVPAGATVLSGFANHTTATASSVAGAEIQHVSYDGGGTHPANQVFASSTDTPGTVTHTFTSPTITGALTVALMVEIPSAG